MIIIVNPHCVIDGSTKQLILCQWQVSFVDSTQNALEILRSNNDLRLIITHATDLAALWDALRSIEDASVLNYMIMLGPQSSQDVTLDELLRNG